MKKAPDIIVNRGVNRSVGDCSAPIGVERRTTMDTKNYTIRLEKEEDYRTVENLVRESF